MPTLKELQDKYGKKTEESGKEALQEAKKIEQKIISPEPEKNIDSLIKANKKATKSKTLRNIENELDKIELTQDDLNSFIRQLCRNTLPSIRESKTNLIPIFLDFVNKKLKKF